MPIAAPCTPPPPDLTAIQAAALRTFSVGNVTADALRQKHALLGLDCIELRFGRPVVTELGLRALRAWDRKQVAA
jgi:hypothetical protein